MIEYKRSNLAPMTHVTLRQASYGLIFGDSLFFLGSFQSVEVIRRRLD